MALPKPRVVVARPVKDTIADWDSFTGTVVAKETVEVRPKVSGEIVRVHFKEGAEIEENAPLFDIDPEPFRLRLLEAKGELAALKAQLALAEKRAATYEPLAKTGAASALEYAKALADKGDIIGKITAAEGRIQQISLDLRYCQIRSAIAGRVGKALRTRGNYVTAGQDILAVVVQVDPLYVEFTVNERSYLRYKKKALERGQGQTGSAIPVEMELVEQAGPRFKGVVDFIDSRLDPSTGTILLRARFANPKGPGGIRPLTPGLFARVFINTSGEYNAILVPERSILTDLTLKYVLVVDKDADNRVKRVDVRLGRLRENGLRVIESGLAGDEWVIIEGATRARPGISVEAIEEEARPGGSDKGRASD